MIVSRRMHICLRINIVFDLYLRATHEGPIHATCVTRYVLQVTPGAGKGKVTAGIFVQVLRQLSLVEIYANYGKPA